MAARPRSFTAGLSGILAGVVAGCVGTGAALAQSPAAKTVDPKSAAAVGIGSVPANRLAEQPSLKWTRSGGTPPANRPRQADRHSSKVAAETITMRPRRTGPAA